MPIAFFLWIHCSRERELTQKGKEKESKGSYAEAIFDYQKALQSNPEYGPANKRMGFLLSESQLSVIPAINHLEKALKSDPEDLEIVIKLVDLTFMIGDITKSKKLLTKYSEKIPQETLLFLETTKSCLEADTEIGRKKALAKIDTLDIPSDAHLYYRSVALCYEKNGLTNSAENFVNQYGR